MLDRKTFLMGGLLAAGLLPARQARAASRARRDFERFCDLFYRQKRVREAFETYVAPDYIQHSAGMAQGRDAAIATLEPMFSRAGFETVPVRTFWEGNLSGVILDVRVGDAVRAIVVDFFRHAGGRIVEHWDVKAELGAEQRGGYFDGLRK
jgi:predicted SnoaL-like aldol condensation-catalyzing enzyme